MARGLYQRVLYTTKIKEFKLKRWWIGLYGQGIVCYYDQEEYLRRDDHRR